MRPCNQCKRPVENDVFVCDDCLAYNEEHGYESPKPIKAFTGDLPTNSDIPHDRSMDTIAMFFYGSLIVGAALIGCLQGGLSGFFIGGVVGFVIASMVVRLLIA